MSKKFYQTHDALLSISEQKYIDSDDRQKSHPRYFFKDYLTIKNEFKDLPLQLKIACSLLKNVLFFDENRQICQNFSDKRKENELLKLKSETAFQKD